jgi:hypothetical protein
LVRNVEMLLIPPSAISASDGEGRMRDTLVRHR